ncbi:F-box domain-containing protein [Fusarium keratoplasticum]|uniref:F-box domain-containing protein n=1 Tax=Fusarium keratoplasticum TaxID=1328300 RepID=A0ACC0R229_9HYPO|nr:F-box domain-containing protein [Fusarium keratoplasticum]KAI8671673.1 F-box domain-containing protein [Fusarium keratoplasticum]KAI8678896.1 F-box domain-containing protein [Fusarium keratoplasticum]
MTKRIIPVNDWAPAHEAMMEPPAESSAMGAAAASESQASAPGVFRPETGSGATTYGHRHRSMSLSLPWRRPKSFVWGHDSSHHLSRHFNDLAIDDTEEEVHESGHGASHGHGHEHHHHFHTPGAIKGIIRRASVSFNRMVHRRPSGVAEDVPEHHSARPITSHGHSTWSRLRQATIRHSRSIYGLDLNHEHGFHHQQEHPSNLPIPGFRGEPPIIPDNSGAAAKASAAMQNEYYARQSLYSMWLNPSTNDESNDRESGIGITVTLPGTEEADAESVISKIDFVTKLPTELAIHILACLDAAALTKASEVCRSWKNIISNQHIWRESCLRETTTTYATSTPVTPGTGLGVPAIAPTNDWREIYRVKQQLTHRWKGGKASPVYLNGHKDSIYCLQFDEHKIITGSRDKTIRVWDMHTLQCRLAIGPPEVIHEPDMLLDEEGNPTHFATGSDNERTAPSMPTLASFPTHHKASILCLQYDDEILVTGSSDSTCIVYNVKAGYRPIRQLRRHTAAVLDLAFDDKHIVTCSKDFSICVWERETGNLLKQLRGHSGPVNAVQMRANTIVSCSGDFRVKLWNIETGKNIREFTGHTKGLACSQFSEDGRYIASAGNDKVIRIWDANTGECLREMRAHENLVRSLHIDSVSGRLISGSYDTDIKVWDMETGHQLLDFPGWHASWVLSAKSDYRRIVSTGQDPKILIMDFGADVDGIEMLECGQPVETDGGFI